MQLLQGVLLLAAILATLFSLVIFWRSYRRRNQIVLRVRSHLDELPFSEGEIQRGLEGAFERIRCVDGSRRMAAYEVSSDISRSRPYQEELGGKAGEIFINAMAPWFIQLLIVASERLVKATVIETDLSRDETRLILSAVCTRGSERVAKVVVSRRATERPGSDELTWELVCRMLVKLFDTLGAEVASLGTASWRAFQKHCEAMSLWLDTDRQAADEDRVERLLEEAVEEDPGYLAALYNRAAFTYNRRLEWRSMDRALARFRAVYHATDVAEGLPDATRRRLRGYACVGVARCLAQGAHRYGRADVRRVSEAREFGREAIELLGRTPQALYAAAFSWNCLEMLDDLKRGRELYEEILVFGVFPIVLNNLAFVCARAGEEVERLNGAAAGASWYRDALAYARQATETMDPNHRAYRMAWANRGAAQRLLGRHEKALAHFRQALGYDPEAGVPDDPGYLEGLSEYAEVVLDRGLAGGDETAVGRGLDLHEMVLGHAEDRGHLKKLAEQTGRCIARKRPAARDEIEALLNRWDKLERAPFVELWLSGLRRELVERPD